MLKGFFKKADIILFVILIGIGIASTLGLHLVSKAGDKVTVTVDGKLYGEYKLGENRIIPVKRGNNLNIVVIKDGRVTMSEASCKNQVCVKHKAINRTGESIICLPNKVIVSIVGKEKPKYDSISS